MIKPNSFLQKYLLNSRIKATPHNLNNLTRYKLSGINPSSTTQSTDKIEKHDANASLSTMVTFNKPDEKSKELKYNIQIPFQIQKASDEFIQQKWTFPPLFELKNLRLKGLYDSVDSASNKKPSKMNKLEKPDDIKGIPHVVLQLLYNLRLSSCTRVNHSNFFYISYYSPSNFLGTFRKSPIAIMTTFNKKVVLNDLNVPQNMKEKFTKSMAPYDYANYRLKTSRLYKDIFFQMYKAKMIPQGFYQITAINYPTEHNFHEFKKDLDILATILAKRRSINQRISVNQSNKKIQWDELENTLQEHGLELPENSRKLRDEIMNDKGSLRKIIEKSDDFMSLNNQYNVPYKHNFNFTESCDKFYKKNREVSSTFEKVHLINLSNFDFNLSMEKSSNIKFRNFTFRFINSENEIILKSLNISKLQITNIKQDKNLTEVLNEFIETFIRLIKMDDLSQLIPGKYSIRFNASLSQKILQNKESQLPVNSMKSLYEYIIKEYITPIEKDSLLFDEKEENKDILN